MEASGIFFVSIEGVSKGWSAGGRYDPKFRLAVGAGDLAGKRKHGAVLKFDVSGVKE